MRYVFWMRADAAGYVSEIADKVREAAGHLPATWADGVLHRLKHEGPERVLRHLSRLARRFPQIQEQVIYLQKRRALMEYPIYQRQGWPIGSGCVESGHKLVMQARLKGPGMHWRPEHTGPMLTVRLALLNERWEEAWQAQRCLWQHQQHLKRRAHQQQRFQEQQAKRQQANPPPSSVLTTAKAARQKMGRSQAQYRWGRQTISRRLLQQANGAKK